jgi:DNA-directed RNA polymerase subunit N (RpoN/RPB10)
LSSIDLINIDDWCSDREIDDFLAREDLENQCSRREVITHVEQYDFMTNLPPCIKGKEGFLGIGHELEETIGKNEVPLVDHVSRRSAISPVHCDSCLNWIERYYTDVPFLQARVKHWAT